MRHCRIIFLLLSSLLLNSCIYKKLSSYEKRSDYSIPSNKFNNVDRAVKYKASIDVLNKHFTGLIVFKKTDADTRHLVFVTELGMSMFDFIVKGDSMKPAYVFDALNKPQTVEALVRNFETIFMVKWVDKKIEKREKSGKLTLYLKDGNHERFIIEGKEKESSEQWVFYKRKKETRTTYSPEFEKIKLKQFGLIKIFIELDKISE